MRPIFTKRNGKYDVLVRDRGERAMALNGFLNRVVQGEIVAATVVGTADSDAVERMMECVQAGLWLEPVSSQPMSLEDFQARYEQAYRVPDHGATLLSLAEIRLIKDYVADLTARWSKMILGGVRPWRHVDAIALGGATPVNGSLVLGE